MNRKERLEEFKNRRYRGINMFSSIFGNCYVLRGMDGDVLIDTGDSRCRDEIEVWLTNYDIKLIVLTHGHNDHIGNAAFLSELLDVPVAMDRFDVPLIRNKKQRHMYAMNAVGIAGTPLRSRELKRYSEVFKPDILLEDGMRLCDTGVEGILSSARIVALDGHTRGSIGIFDGKDLYCGDAVVDCGTALEPQAAESPRAALHTLSVIAGLDPERIFPGHGGPVIRGDRLYDKMIDKYLIY